MKLMKILLIALAVPLSACAAIQSAGIGTPDGFEDLPEVYNVFFGFDTAELDEAGEAIVIQAAADAKQFSPGSIQISGFPDPAPGEATAGLAEQRFVVVEGLMATQGIDRALFVRGQLRDDLALPDVTIRRIEIRFAFD